MSDPLSKAIPNQRQRTGDGPLSAQFHNLAVDAIKFYLREDSGRFGVGDMAAPMDRDTWVVNDGSTDVDQYGVVGQGAPAILPSQSETNWRNQTLLHAAAPKVGKPFAITLEPIGKGGGNRAGKVVLAGPVKCKIKMQLADDGFADCQNNNYINLVSQSDLGPATILWHDDLSNKDSAGLVWAFVLLNQGGGDGVGPSEASAEIWCNNTVAAGVNTLQDQEHVAAVVYAGNGLARVIFDRDFKNQEAFTWSGSTKGGMKFLHEVNRTNYSVTVQTSDLQDAERWGIMVMGHLGTVGSGSGSPPPPPPGPPCGPCAHTLDEYCTSFPEAVRAGDVCLSHDPPEPTAVVLQRTTPGGCTWARNTNQWAQYHCSLRFFPASAGYHPFGLDGSPPLSEDSWILEQVYYDGGSMPFAYAYWTAPLASWNCNSPLVMTNRGGGFDREITIYPGPCGTGPPAPTVDFSDDDLCQDAATITITGTGFNTTASDNTVTFNLGAAGTVTSVNAAGTSMVVTFATNPTSLGALTAVVTTLVGNSNPPVQVAHVIDCGGTIPFSACPGGIRSTLYLRPEPGNSCAGLPSVQTMTYNATGVNGAAWYTPIITLGGFPFYFYMKGAGANIDLHRVCNGVDTVAHSGPPSSCSPFNSGGIGNVTDTCCAASVVRIKDS